LVFNSVPSQHLFCLQFNQLKFFANRVPCGTRVELAYELGRARLWRAAFGVSPNGEGSKSARRDAGRGNRDGRAPQNCNLDSVSWHLVQNHVFYRTTFLSAGSGDFPVLRRVFV